MQLQKIEFWMGGEREGGGVKQRNVCETNDQWVFCFCFCFLSFSKNKFVFSFPLFSRWMVHFEMTTKSARLELKNNKLTQQIKPRPKKEKLRKINKFQFRILQEWILNNFQIYRPKVAKSLWFSNLLDYMMFPRT